MKRAKIEDASAGRRVDRIAFRLDKFMLGHEVARRSLESRESLRARMDLGRFYSLLSTALPLPFNEDDAAIMVRACGGSPILGARGEFYTLPMLKAHLVASVLSVADANAVLADLALRISSLSPLQIVAVIDAVERYSVEPSLSVGAAFGLVCDVAPAAEASMQNVAPEATTAD